MGANIQGVTSSRAENSSFGSFQDKLLQANDDDKKKPAPKIIDAQVRKEDPRILEWQKRIAERKKTQGALPDQTVVIDPVGEAQKIGVELAATKGGQFVLIGEDHTEIDQWQVLLSIMESYEKSKSKDDKRPVIFIDEDQPSPSSKSFYESWNAIDVSKREPGTLGDHYVKNALHYDSVGERLDNLKKKIKDRPRLIREMPYAFVLNELSKLRPDINVYYVDTNQGVSHPVSDVFNQNFADRDTVMAFNIQALREAYPNALIVGSFGGNHVVERSPDSVKKIISDAGTNRNDSMAEQLSLLNEEKDNKNVWTVRVVVPGRVLNTNSSGQDVSKDVGQYDKVIYIEHFDWEKAVSPKLPPPSVTPTAPVPTAPNKPN